MPLTHDQMNERFEALANSVKHKLEQKGYTEQEIGDLAIHVAKTKFMKLQLKICKELQAEYKISYKEAFFILNNITKTRSSDDVLSIMKQYNIDDIGLDITSRLQQYYSISFEDAARETSLIKSKEKLYSYNTQSFIKKLLSAPGSQYKSISEIANTLSKYNITDEQILKLSAHRTKDIISGKITLDEALQNTVKYGIYGSYGQDTGTKPYSFIDSVKEFFGFKSSSESIETPAQEIKAAELIDNAHNIDANE